MLSLSWDSPGELNVPGLLSVYRRLKWTSTLSPLLGLPGQRESLQELAERSVQTQADEVEVLDVLIRHRPAELVTAGHVTVTSDVSHR